MKTIGKNVFIIKTNSKSFWVRKLSISRHLKIYHGMEYQMVNFVPYLKATLRIKIHGLEDTIEILITK